jgi:hypothetical protein
MSRNTHDQALDHHGAFTTGGKFADQGSDPSSPTSGQHVIYSKADGMYVKGSGGDVVGPLGSGGGGGLTDLLTGNDSEFTTTVGNWTNSGGTLSRDTTAGYKLPGLSASLKFVTTGDNQYISVPVNGTFVAGTEYQAAVMVMTEDNTADFLDFTMTFGLYGTDVKQISSLGSAGGLDDAGSWLVVRWIPSSNRTGVTLRFQRNAGVTGNTTFHIMYARAVETSKNSPAISITTLPAYNSSYDANLTIGTGLPVTKIQYGLGGGFVQLGRKTAAIGTAINPPTSLYSDAGYLALYAEHTMGDKAQEGVDVEVGEDYLGFFISQKNATTVQFYGDYDDYNFEFEDGAANGWKFVSGDGAVAWPAKGMLPSRTAAPSTPVEGESYYDSVLNKARLYTGSSWVDMSATSSSGILETIIDAKGDLIVGSSADSPVKVTVGADGTVLTADSNETAGVKWVSAAAGATPPVNAAGLIYAYNNFR